MTVIAGCRAQQLVEDSIDVVKESFDNNLTPYYALVIAIWGSSVSVALAPPPPTQPADRRLKSCARQVAFNIQTGVRTFNTSNAHNEQE